jgi:uncharacterized protein YodC (DUF2158 family)
MSFNVGDSVQPVIGGQRMRVVSVEGDTVECQWTNLDQEQTRTFNSSELALYKEDEDFGVC